MGGPSRGAGDELAAPWITNPAARHALVQRHSTPWGVAGHALECLDYDLTGEFGPWAPPPPFAGIGGWQITSLPAAWTRSDILGYIDYCRQRVRDTLDGIDFAYLAQNARVLLYPEGMVKLNASAGEILARCDGVRNAAQIVADLEQAFQRSGLHDDVLGFLTLAQRQGWVTL